MSEPERCAACGARNTASAAWCSQCHAPLGDSHGGLAGASPAGLSASGPSPTSARADGAVAGGTSWTCPKCGTATQGASTCARCGAGIDTMLYAQQSTSPFGTAPAAGLARGPSAGSRRRPGRGLLERARTGFRLVMVGLRTAWHAPQLLIVPLLGFLMTLAVLGVVAAVLGIGPAELLDEDAERSAGELAGVLVIVFVGYVTGVLSQATVVLGATDLFDGRRPSLTMAFERVLARVGPLLVWAGIDMVVGILLDVLRQWAERHGGFAGRAAVGAARVAWHTVTALVIPAILFEQAGAMAAIRRSKQLFRKVWGQTLVGAFGLGLALVLVSLLVILALLPLAALSLGLTIALMLVALVFIQLVGAVASGGLKAALYRYATRGEVPAPYHAQDLQVPSRMPPA